LRARKRVFSLDTVRVAHELVEKQESTGKLVVALE